MHVERFLDGFGLSADGGCAVDEAGCAAVVLDFEQDGRRVVEGWVVQTAGEGEEAFYRFEEGDV